MSLALLSLLSCSEQPLVMECLEGQSIACSCESGQSGAQICLEGGLSWGECSCSEESAPPADTDPGGEDSMALDDDSGEAAGDSSDDTGGIDSVGPPPEEVVLDVYLLGGQSNMDGGGMITGLPPSLQLSQTDVSIFWSGTGQWQGLTGSSYWSSTYAQYFGPEVTFGRTLADADPEQPVALIKHAIGGTDLASCWYPGTSREDPARGACYQGFIETVDQGLIELDLEGTAWRIAGMSWMQGESDACYEDWAWAYEENLTSFIQRVREDVSAPDMPFSLGIIDCSTHCPYRDIVREAQAAVAEADELVYAVDTEDLPQNADALHFDASGMRTLGERLARAILGETDQVPTPQPAFQFSGVTYSNYTGDFFLGYVFELEQAIEITDLGVLDYSWDGLSDAATVGLWDAVSEDLIAQHTLPANASAPTSIWGGWRFAAIEPLQLEPGRYILGSQVYSGSADRYVHNAEVSQASGIQWLEARHNSGTAVALPTIVNTAEASWFGPNFLFTER